MAKTDGELVAASLQGDPRAFEEIVARHQRLVFNIIYHYLGRRNDVEDMAQEVFLRVFTSLESFDQGRPLEPWVSRITVNCCLDELRKVRSRKLVLFSDLNEGEEDRIRDFFDQFNQRTLWSQAEAEESFGLLHKLMNKLSGKDRMAFVLREIQGVNYPELAEILNTTELGARIRVSRARQKLQKAFAKIVIREQGRKP